METRPSEGRRRPVGVQQDSEGSQAQTQPSHRAGTARVTLHSPMAQADGPLRARNLWDPQLLTPHSPSPGQACPRPPPSALLFPDSKETDLRRGEGSHPSHGTLCHPHPGHTKSHLSSCPGLHACHLQSVLSSQRVCKTSGRAHDTPTANLPWLPPPQGRARVLTGTRQALPPSGHGLHLLCLSPY